MKKQIYIRVDGNATIGLGHLVRCLALAEMLKSRFNITFFSREIPQSLADELKFNGFELEFIEADETFFKRLNNHVIVILDGYHFNTDYQRSIINSGCKLVCIDDLNALHFVAHAVINFGLSLMESDYSCENYTKLLIGLDYALLRKPFREQIKVKELPLRTGPKTAFVCFGGSDKHNLTEQTVDILLGAGFDHINIVVGNAYSNTSIAQKYSGIKTINIYKSVSAAEMAEIMRNSNFAVVPASSVLLEIFTVGMPVISGYYALNQVGSLDELTKRLLIMNCGNMLKGYAHNLLYLITEYKRGKNSEAPAKQKSIMSDPESRYLEFFETLSIERGSLVRN